MVPAANPAGRDESIAPHINHRILFSQFSARRRIQSTDKAVMHIKNKILFITFSLLSLLAMAALMLSPATAAQAVRQGLGTCAGVIVPSLLPFFFASNLISALGLPGLLAAKSAGLLQRYLGISGHACAPLLLGLCGGYPIGAAALAEAVRRGELGAEEASRLLPKVNNTGPAFIIGAAGSAVFGSTKIGALLYASHIVAAFAASFLFSTKNEAFLIKNEQFLPDFEFSEILPDCVKKSVLSVINICGFVVFFTIITAFFEQFGVFTYLAGEMSVRLGAELHFCRSLLLGILELGSGIASMSGLSPAPANLALASFILGFGSLSVHCQTLAVVSGSNIKCARHFAGRIFHGAFSALFTYVVSMLFRI